MSQQQLEESVSEPRDLLVVGGAAGIGAAIAAAWTAGPCTVWSRRSGVDAADDDQVAQATRDLSGAPWGLVHAVGDFDERPLLDTDRNLYEHLLRSNLTTAMTVLRHVVPAMVARVGSDSGRSGSAGGGRVLLFAAAGVGRERAMRRAPVYFAIKEAVVALARSLAAEVAAHGITVNVLSPGIIEHPHSHSESQRRMASKVPMQRTGTVADVVPMALHLLGDDGAYTTGSNITIDGALSL